MIDVLHAVDLGVCAHIVANIMKEMLPLGHWGGTNEKDEGKEESDEESLGEGEEGERIGLEEEGEFVRKMIDPKLPTQEEVELVGALRTTPSCHQRERAS